MRNGNYIRTFTGKAFYPLDPREEDIEIEDIAHALSNICRYTGQCREFYSVAQHSYHVSREIQISEQAGSDWRDWNPELALWGLLHDASEAYICDISRPVKQLPELATYREIEDNIMRVVARKFGLPEEMPENIHTIDRRMLVTEMQQLMPVDTEWKYWRDTNGVHPFEDVRLFPAIPEVSKIMFMTQFNSLIKQHAIR